MLHTVAYSLLSHTLKESIIAPILLPPEKLTDICNIVGVHEQRSLRQMRTQKSVTIFSLLY